MKEIFETSTILQIAVRHLESLPLLEQSHATHSFLERLKEIFVDVNWDGIEQDSEASTHHMTRMKTEIMMTMETPLTTWIQAPTHPSFRGKRNITEMWT
jgi:hypothetical protein